jgi:segregation and condensation protein B
VVGYRDVPGKPALFGTTKAFLDYFNLTSLDDLPSLAEIKDMESFEPELDLGDGGAYGGEAPDGADEPLEADAPGGAEAEDEHGGEGPREGPDDARPSIH